MQNKINIEKIRTHGEAFFKNLLLELEDLELPVSTLKADHLCFRVETMDEYTEYKNALLAAGTLLTEAPVNGRPIPTFLLNKPFRIGSHSIPLLELPAPKSGAHYSTGFEHAEFVIKESFDLFAARFLSLNFSKSGNKNINPELCLKTRWGQAKFHHLSLERVIEIEKAKIKNIIFDLDGTLIKSRENIYEINRIVFSQALDRNISLEEIKEKYYSEFSKLFDAFGIECLVMKKRAVSAWGEVSERFSYDLFDGVADFIKKVSDSQYDLHIWTARVEKSARSILAHHGIESIFKTMSFATEVDSKPHGKSLKFDWESMDKNSAIVIGDSPSDIFGSKNIGAVGAAALWDPHAHENALIASGAELFFHSVHELENWIMAKLERVI